MLLKKEGIKIDYKMVLTNGDGLNYTPRQKVDFYRV